MALRHRSSSRTGSSRSRDCRAPDPSGDSMKDDADPEGRRLPVKVDATSNGEFAPIPLEAPARHANALAAERATTLAKYVGKSRREFLVSSCGDASTLLALNAA